MQNLPVIYKNMLKGCKVFALVGALSLCCACGGSDTAETPEAGSTASPMSGEVEVSGGEEVESTSGEATASEEGKTEEAKAEEGSEEAASDEASAESSEGGEKEVASADAGAEAKAEEAKAEEAKVEPSPTRVRTVGNVRDPFNKFYGDPAIGTSLTGNTSKIINKGKTEVSAGYKKKVAAKKAKESAEAVVKVSKPNVKVTGILRSGANYKAILQGPEKAIMVSSGENIAGYRIAAISDKDVTLVYKNKYKFVLPMEKETFGSTGAPVEDASKDANPIGDMSVETR